MKQFLVGWLLVFGLAFVGERAAAANMRAEQDQFSSPNQSAPAPNRQAPSFRQNQRTEPSHAPMNVPVKPSGVLNVPSGVLNVPSGVLFKPPGVVSTLPGENRAPRQNFVGGQGELRHFRPGGDAGRGDFRRRGHRSLIVVYVNGAPCWYPVYTAYPYYYDAPLAPTYDSGYYGNSGYVPTVEDSGNDSSGETGSSYADVGTQWGQDLRREVATWDQFVDYIRNYIVAAAPTSQADFREAFISSYGINGAAAYDKAAGQAASSTAQGPKVINLRSGY
jgi:hypothetical protein